MRISDVSMRRLIDIIKLVKENFIIVTMTRFVRMLTDVEKERGYQYQVSFLLLKVSVRGLPTFRIYMRFIFFSFWGFCLVYLLRF